MTTINETIEHVRFMIDSQGYAPIKNALDICTALEAAQKRIAELEDIVDLRKACYEGIVIANKQILDLTGELEIMTKRHADRVEKLEAQMGGADGLVYALQIAKREFKNWMPKEDGDTAIACADKYINNYKEKTK